MNDILNFKQTCDYLQLSKSSLYKLTSKKEIPHYKPGGKRIYFKRSDLDEWITNGKVPTSEELRLQIEFSNSDLKKVGDD
jgi:excisionase family DNA binding protein